MWRWPITINRGTEGQRYQGSSRRAGYTARWVVLAGGAAGCTDGQSAAAQLSLGTIPSSLALLGDVGVDAARFTERLEVVDDPQRSLDIHGHTSLFDQTRFLHR